MNKLHCKYRHWDSHDTLTRRKYIICSVLDTDEYLLNPIIYAPHPLVFSHLCSLFFFFPVRESSCCSGLVLLLVQVTVADTAKTASCKVSAER